MSAHANHPSYTAMERLIQQTMIVRQCLNKENAKVRLEVLYCMNVQSFTDTFSWSEILS